MRRWTAVGVALAACVVVWMTASAQATSEWVVSSDRDNGAGTLRVAILNANESDGDDRIRFASAMTIRPESPLPPLEDDGITIDGSFGNASPDVVPAVWIDGTATGDSAGLEVFSPRGVVRGLGIIGFQRYGIGVIGAEASGAVIEGNWVGLRANGLPAANRLSGVAVIGGAAGAAIRDNRIGGNSDARRTGHGIVVGGGGSVDVRIEGNVIGIALDGSAAPNDDGILIVDSAQATIRDNAIGYSKVAGVELRETRQEVRVESNRIGVRRDGAAAPNDVGVFLGPGSAEAKIGGWGVNIIAANRVGIAVEQGARDASIANNWIGLVPLPGVSTPRAADLPRALIRPNVERGISIIAGAAVILVEHNYVVAGKYGIVVGDAATTRVSLTRNVIAGSRQGVSTAAIDVRSGTEIVIGGGDEPFGNHVCGAEFGIRIGNTEEPLVGFNAVGAGAASRVTFDSDAEMQWGIRLEDRTLRAQVQQNYIADAGRAAISVVGDDAQDNRLSLNRYSRNALDIDLGADGRTENDSRDRDRGPNGLLNAPTIDDHEVRQVSASIFSSTFSGTATPGSYVDVYELNGARWDRIARSQRADHRGRWSARTLELPNAPIRALAMTAAGSTSEFSLLFLPSQRVRLESGTNYVAWTGPDMAIEEAMSPILPWVETVWRWNAREGKWEGWSPRIPADAAGRGGSLAQVRTGDVLRLALSDRPSRSYFVPAGGELTDPTSIELARGFNQITWLGGKVGALEMITELDQRHPGLIASVWQWDDRGWALIWPRLRGAWDPGVWEFSTLWIRATDGGALTLP
ncbi:MAG: right-handed parallel beta-helix repeat-containing protein [Chloroflexi bacterium]|nr:right-handed parallel beta-helix repeat-containing protein [Chloroflexota bacterium]